MKFWRSSVLSQIVFCCCISLFTGCDGCDSKRSVGAFSGPATQDDGLNKFMDGPELDQLTNEYADIAFFDMTHESYMTIKDALSQKHGEIDTNLSAIRIRRSKNDHVVRHVGTVTASAVGKDPWDVSFDFHFLRTMENNSVSNACIYAEMGGDVLLDRREDHAVVETLNRINSSLATRQN